MNAQPPSDELIPTPAAAPTGGETVPGIAPGAAIATAAGTAISTAAGTAIATPAGTATGTATVIALGAGPDAAEAPPRSRLGRLVDLLLGKAATMVLAALALAVGIATFVLLAGSPESVRPDVEVGLVLANLISLLLLGAALAGRLTLFWVERRRGSAGSLLHVRLVLLFSGIAVAPTIFVAFFAVALFHFGIQSL